MPSRDRERELARRRYERRLARQQQTRAQRRRRSAIASGVVALLAVAGVLSWWLVASGGTSSSTQTLRSSPTPTPSVSSAAAALGQCAYTPSHGGQVKSVGTPPTTNVAHTGTYLMTLQTNRGTIKIAMDAAKAPCTVNSFDFLASKHYFNGVKCHRLTTSGIYVLQCGDPSGTGAGGPGYQFKDENLSAFGPAGSQVTYPAGTVAMANAGPGTNGSQFFLVYKNSPLQAAYTPFGRIISGLQIVQQVAAGGVTGGSTDGAPKEPVVLQQVTVTKQG